MLTELIIGALLFLALLGVCRAWVNGGKRMKGIIAGLLIAGVLAWYTYNLFM